MNKLAKTVEISKAERQRRNYMRIVVAQALLLTVLVHVILLLVFRYQSPKNDHVASKKSNTISIFSLANYSAERQASISNWLDIHNPAIIARTDNPYSSVNTLPKPPQIKTQQGEMLHSYPSIKSPQVTDPQLLTLGRMPVTLPSTNLQELPKEFPPKTISYPQLWVNGSAQEFNFSTLLLEQSRAKNAYPTKIELIPQGREMRFNIVASSGNVEFDMLVVSELLKRYRNENKFLQLNIIWQAEEGKR